MDYEGKNYGGFFSYNSPITALVPTNQLVILRLILSIFFIIRATCKQLLNPPGTAHDFLTALIR